MLKSRITRNIIAMLLLLPMLSYGVVPGAEDQSQGQNPGNQQWGDFNPEWFNNNRGGQGQSQGTAEGGGLTIEGEIDANKLYTDALTVLDTERVMKFTKVRRGTFSQESSFTGTIVYTEQETYVKEFPYGKVYLNTTAPWDQELCKKGDVLATVYVELDEIEVTRLELKLKRMEERGETGAEYERAKAQLTAMQEAVADNEIVAQASGYLLERDGGVRGMEIQSYRYVVANENERLISVPNTSKSFRYGQRVKVTGLVGNEEIHGMGTVINAQTPLMASELSSETVYIRLDESDKAIYDARKITVSVESIHMENVLLLSTNTVYVKNGAQLVKIQDENGLHVAGLSFGRMGSSEYWVIDGLSEGTDVLIQ